ncbi:MAG: M48 family metallopeptidase, partial [Hydrogenophaga sp.]|nr:M48 family metallopeptidase [Hydrogenophaga sp.]
MQRFVQLALDFLTGPEPVVLSQPPAPVAKPRPAAPPAEPLSEVFQPGTWHHPRANRLLKLGSCDVAYEFKRGKRRTIGLSVGPDGLSVSAPRWTPVGEVEALLHDKAGWVLEKLQNARQR